MQLNPPQAHLRGKFVTDLVDTRLGGGVVVHPTGHVTFFESGLLECRTQPDACELDATGQACLALTVHDLYLVNLRA